MAILHYIHDPMCSWCWGFRPAWDEIRAALPELRSQLSAELTIDTILGGLAPDSMEAMPLVTQHYVRDHWRRIQEVIPGTEFNYDFWTLCQPRRSTYIACRAVIAAAQQGEQYGELMTLAIQHAYYLQAKNPSDEEVLRGCAESIGINVARFTNSLGSDAVQQLLQADITRYHSLAEQAGASGFPSLVLSTEGRSIGILIDYSNAQASLNFIRAQLV
ncbi:MAG: putative protein-disulfide isomerase [Kiritimatiellia bacterium]|jgi:putative protein-disulfide isomerase